MKAQVIKINPENGQILVKVRRSNTIRGLYAYNIDLSHLKIGDSVKVEKQVNNPYLIYKGMFKVVE